MEKVNRFSESSLEKLENGFQFLFVDGVKVVEIKKIFNDNTLLVMCGNGDIYHYVGINILEKVVDSSC